MFDTEPTFVLPEDWLTKLRSQLPVLATERSEEVNRIADLFGDPIELARLYVQPDCQQLSPADYMEADETTIVKEPIFSRLEQFCASPHTSTSLNQLLILADAGMGKTSLMVMFALGHLASLWPQPYESVLLKLGSNTLNQLEKISGRRTKILLLDALDEDPTAWARHEPRLKELLAATGNFRKVIMTCRSQYFAGEKDYFHKRGVLTVGGNRLPVIYLSHFSDAQVERYISMRFPADHGRRQEALAMMPKMRALRSRPMLLAHIEDLLDTSQHSWTEFTVYEALVSAWLRREENRHRERQGHDVLTAKGLWQACSKLAWWLHTTGATYISDSDLQNVIGKDRTLRHIRLVDIRGRSLLNKTAEGAFRFAHLSVQEFLLVHRLLSEGSMTPDGRMPDIRFTDQMISFLLSRLSEPDARERVSPIVRRLSLRGVDLSGGDLAGVDLSGIDLSGSRLDRCNLRGAEMPGANLSEVSGANIDLSEANIERAVFDSADLLNVILVRSNAAMVSAVGAQCGNATANNANFAGGRFDKAVFDGSTLTGACFRAAHAEFLMCRRASAEGVDFREALLEGAKFDDSAMDGSDWSSAAAPAASFRGTQLRRALFGVASLRDCDFTEADLRQVDFRSADLRGANLNMAKVAGADFRGANIAGINTSGSDWHLTITDE